MQMINWLELQPLPADLDALRAPLQAALPLWKVCQLLVERTLRAYPWTGRADLISCYHPSQTYKQGQRLALLIPDPQNVRPTVWQFAQVKQARIAENPVQGRFQVLTIEIHGRQFQMASGIPDASYPEPDPSRYTSEDLTWLVEWVSETYATALRATVKKLIETGQICGQLAGEIFLPEEVSALSPELLHPSFARLSPTRPWISLEEIYQGLPELSQLKRETVLAILHASLKESPYRPLGAGRWTTPELFDQLDREVPRGLPSPRVHAKVPIWTKRDEKELAGYNRKFMPTEARHALEELGIVDKLPQPDQSPWRPPKGPLPFPTLNYLHMTQAYFPVGDLLRAFPPEVQLVFVQLINGDHQPFLLDRENGLLKAVHPQELHARILKADIPAGTSLWLEYEADEKYRIAPRALPFKRMVPCKVAHLEDGHLQIGHTQISMMYEGRPSLFKASLQFEELEALFAEAKRLDLSVREAMVYAIKEICATDPDHRAHRSDIFNAVFLQRVCSPRSISLLLYTQPCFEQLGGGYFRYKPAPDAPVVRVRAARKRKDRLSKLWDNLLSNGVAPDPVAKERTTPGSHLEVPGFAPAVELPTLLRGPETEPEISVPVFSLVAVEEGMAGKVVLKEENRMEALLLSSDEPDPIAPIDTAEPVSHPWSESLDRLLHSLEDLVNEEPSALSTEVVDEETEAVSDLPLEAPDLESVSFSSPFRWEPKPAWLDVPVPPKPPSPPTVDARPLVYQRKIPIRPLHKQPFYRRLFYYLRGWLSRISRKAA